MEMTAVAARKIGPIAKRMAIGMRERAAMAIFSGYTFLQALLRGRHPGRKVQDHRTLRYD